MDINIKKLETAERRYFAECWKLSCMPDLLALRLFPNPKEFTESAGAYRAVEKCLELHPKGLVQVVAVADGNSPRTAAVFALRTAWECHSVDPMLLDRGAWHRIRRLTLHRCRIQDVALPWADVSVVVCVHSHVSLPASLDKIRANHIHVVAIPCCVPLELNRPPDVEYLDLGIWSPHCRVKVWREVRRQDWE